MKENNIICGEDVERTIFSSLGEVAHLLLNVYGENVLQIDAETGEEQSANLLLERAACLAKWFKRNNLKPNDIISINSENCLEYAVVCIAALFEGICCAPFNPEYTKGELLHVVNLSKPKIVFCSPKVVQKMLNLASSHSFIKHIVVFGNMIIKHPNVTMFNDILKDVTSSADYVPAAVNPDETLATILCSSGTTGLPKGVMATHSHIINYIEIVKKIFEFGETEILEGATVGLTPFFHSFGYMQLILNLLRGLKVVLIRKFHPKLFLETIVKYQISAMFIPPPIVIFLTKHPLVKNYDISCIKEVKCGAAALGEKLEVELENRFNINISQGYGLTETTLGVLTIRPGQKKPGSAGQIVPGMMCKVIDEDGNALGPNQEGELCFKGPLIMKGYIGDKKATNATIDENNWLHTGDIGYYDNEGFFFIVDRIKELIKYKAFQVAPAELEALLLTHPKIDDAAVVGLPDEDAGELPLAYIVKKSGKHITAKEVEDFVANNVSAQKRLRGGVQFIDEIPKNPSGKILRRVLKERAKKLRSKL